jgi:hypothetical protein
MPAGILAGVLYPRVRRWTVGGRPRARISRFCAAVSAALGVVGALTACVVSAQQRDSARSICTYYASPDGVDGGQGRGTLRRPFRTFQRLANALVPGATGCLLAGRYVENPDVVHGGTPSAPVVIRSYPGQRAELDGALWVQASARYVTIEHLKLCGSAGPPSCTGPWFSSNEATVIQVSGDHTTFRLDDISNPTGPCVILGTSAIPNGPSGPGNSTLLDGNRIHDCGGAPGSSTTMEGIYDARSIGSTIVRNLIYDNSSMGIQFYPGAQRTTFEYNRVWNNGEGVGFGGGEGMTSNYNTVEYNLIYDSVGGWNIGSFWPEGVGTGNIAAHNCLHADNPNQAGYYNVHRGVQPPSQGGNGFRSYDERCAAMTEAQRHLVPGGLRRHVW